MSLSDDFRYLSMGTFSCNVGYELNGDKSITCQQDKTWSGQEPNCTRKTQLALSGYYSRKMLIGQRTEMQKFPVT